MGKKEKNGLSDQLLDWGFFFPRCAHLPKSCIPQLTKPIQKMASYLVCTWMLQQFLCVAIEAFRLNQSELMYWVRERGPKHRTHKQVLKRKVNCWVFGSTKVQHDLTKRMHTWRTYMGTYMGQVEKIKSGQTNPKTGAL